MCKIDSMLSYCTNSSSVSSHPLQITHSFVFSFVIQMNNKTMVKPSYSFVWLASLSLPDFSISRIHSDFFISDVQASTSMRLRVIPSFFSLTCLWSTVLLFFPLVATVQTLHLVARLGSSGGAGGVPM